MTYRTVFEITQQSYQWWFPAAGTGFAIVSLLFPRRRRGLLFSKWLGVAFGCAWALIMSLSTFPEYYKLHKTYRDGAYATVDGIVQNFDPMPERGHSNECFSVATQRFCYSDYSVKSGFRNTAVKGGPIREGLPVRIAYADGRILKLDIGESRTSGMPKP